MSKVLGIVAIGCGLQLLSATVDAQNAPAGESCQYELARIVSEVGTRLKKTFQVDPRVRGCVSERIDAAKLSYRDLQGLLALYGFVDTMELDGIIQIIPDANARQQSLRLIDERTRDVGEHEMVMKVVDVGPLNAAQLVPILRPLLPQYAHLVAVTNTNSMIIAARYSNIRSIEALVAAVRSRPLVPTAKDDVERNSAAPAK